MAFYDMTHSAVAGPLHRMVARTAHDLRGWYTDFISRNELNKLTDRELDDIGLTRDDLEAMDESERRGY